MENLSLGGRSIRTTTQTTKTPKPSLFPIIDEPLFPRLPGATHKLTIYCRFCAKPYCKNYARYKLILKTIDLISKLGHIDFDWVSRIENNCQRLAAATALH